MLQHLDSARFESAFTQNLKHYAPLLGMLLGMEGSDRGLSWKRVQQKLLVGNA
jgi:hypothetical protein